MLSTGLLVGIWLCQATDPNQRGVDKGQPPIPGAPGRHTCPRSYGREGRGREVTTQARVLSLVHGGSTGRPSDLRLETAQ